LILFAEGERRYRVFTYSLLSTCPKLPGNQWCGGLACLAIAEPTRLMKRFGVLRSSTIGFATWFGSSGGILDAISGKSARVRPRILVWQKVAIFLLKLILSLFPMSRIKNLFRMPKKVTWNLEPKCSGVCLGGGGNGEPTTFRERILVFEYEYSRVRPPPLRSVLKRKA